MKNLKFLLGVVSLASLGLVGFSACDETVDGAKCTGAQPANTVCVTLNNGTHVWAPDNACSRAGVICSGTQTCNATTKQCETPIVAKEFKFVRVDDLSGTKITGNDPGADIDTVALTKVGKSASYPASIRAYKFGSMNIADSKLNDLAKARNPQKAMELDAFTQYPDSSAECTLHKGSDAGEYTYVSLGGLGGYLIVEMKEKIEAGDRIDVLEVGGCKMVNAGSDSGHDAQKEKVKVQISVSDVEAAGSWVVIGEGEGPVVSNTITAADVM